MTRKIYRTAQGKMVDLGRLQLQNENTRAVGNMGVNARGDKLDGNNRPIEARPQQVQRSYNRQTVPEAEKSEPVRPRTARPKIQAPPPPPPPEDVDEDFERDQPVKPPSGLAAAIAKAREVKQDPLRSPQDTAKMQEGVKKL